jgi:histidinol-phosphate aminotransferase
MAISRRTLLARLGAAAAVVAAPRPAAGSVRAVPRGPATDTVRPGGTIRLNRNENAYGPSASVIAAMRDGALHDTCRYPDVETEALRRTIAKFHDVPVEHVVLGCGSSEILRMSIDAFAGPRKTVVAARPTFDVLGAYARRAGAEIVSVPLRRDYSHDLDGMHARTDGATGLVYVCNPNNPTGSLTRRQELEAFVRELPAATHVLIDEAYYDYVGGSSEHASFIDRRFDDPRVIVTRSFSKIHGLAGLRIGYAIADPDTARELASERLSDGVNVVAARAAAAAIQDAGYIRASVSRNMDDRQEFFNQANARMLRPIDSVTNFVMLHTGGRAAPVVEHLRKHNILVAGDIPGFDGHIRVSMGTRPEMREFWRAWDRMPGHRMSM